LKKRVKNKVTVARIWFHQFIGRSGDRIG